MTEHESEIEIEKVHPPKVVIEREVVEEEGLPETLALSSNPLLCQGVQTDGVRTNTMPPDPPTRELDEVEETERP